ncbi:PH domain-containing protein [Clostridium sp. LIBA-8841]|uniref:PH domain-containing protein n=1 Tax=Clostridium sp. LIBA-8841 TaxID=2987530 RepID=UPI002AC696E9|nr:PH domain-containing protein [Clostridium sp. LIBA-8841]MDZ5252713.1 PH domain-containing protein [Clostridium sp. LIBA-8841]
MIYKALALEEHKKFFAIIILMIFIVVMGIAAGLYFYFSNMIKNPFIINLSKNEIRISGWGDAKINLNDIKSMKVVDGPLNIQWNKGGGNFGDKIFGEESLENFGVSKCFVENLNNESIYIKTKSDNYMINLGSNEETLKEYYKILELKKEKENYNIVDIMKKMIKYFNV